MKPDITVFQIYFNDQTKAHLEPRFVPYFNERKDGYFENTVIMDIYDKIKGSPAAPGQYVGVSSWKQRQKTGLTGEEIISHIEADAAKNTLRDIYIYSPASTIDLQYTNIPEGYQANGIIKDENIWDIHKRWGEPYKSDVLLNKHKVLPFDIFDGRWAFVSCNYWIARREVFDEYCEKVLRPSIQFFERPDIKKIASTPWYNHSHENKQYPSYSFVMEGLFGAFLAHTSYSYSYICKKKIGRRVTKKIHITGYNSPLGLIAVNETPSVFVNKTPQDVVMPAGSIRLVTDSVENPKQQEIKAPQSTPVVSQNCSAIVLNWNESHVSVATVENLLKENIDVVVIDNGSTDNSPEKFKKFGNKIKLVLLNKNYGSSIGRNMGIDMIENKFAFLIDGDIEYVPGTIDYYSRILEQYPDCACVGYFDWEHRKKMGWAHGTKDKNKADKAMTPVAQIGHWYPMSWTQYGLFRTEVLKKYRFVTVPPFNQAGYGFEDDWLYREFSQDGWKSFHVNKPFYYHDAHFSVREMKKQEIDVQIEQRKKVFYAKWGNGTVSADIIDSLPKKYFDYAPVKRKVDVIMLSYTKDEAIYKMTKEAISTLRSSEGHIDFNLHLIETNKNLLEKFPKGYDANVIIPEEEFNYNKFVNVGLKKCHADYVVIVNNDVIFEKSWFTNAAREMEEKGIDSASPFWKGWFDITQFPVPEENVSFGYEVGRQVFGYCFIVKRSVFDKIGNLDERFEFWCQDNDYARQLKDNGLTHALIKNSVVNHLMSKSHALIDEEKKEHFTNGMLKVFDEKYSKEKI